MKLRFEILQENDSDLVIKHKDEFYSDYLDYSIEYAPKKDESVILNIVTYHSVYEDKVVYTNLNDTDVVADIYSNAPDGHYTIDHLVLPNKLWYDKYILAKEGQVIDQEGEEQIEIPDGPFDVSNEIEKIVLNDEVNIIYYDGENVIHVVDGQSEPIENLSILADANFISTVYRLQSDTFLIGNLYKCFINISMQILDACIDRCLTEQNSTLSYIRNIVWMGINAIKYLVDQEHLSKAQQILERLMACPGLCSNPKPNINTNSCGCNRKAQNEIRPRF